MPPWVSHTPARFETPLIVPVFTRQRPAAGVRRIREATVPERPATASERRQVRATS
jgi:hypothetical protein